MNLLMVIFGLIAIFAAVGTVQTLKKKQVLGFLFNLVTFLVFGAFTVATVITQGYPPALH
ncbi:DUF2759 domain-containing protein [Planococcus sp. YIM B11945]|uniref:DUF2759 domain-containing protein n=1 Tax=Planococcus sp. YIM B11945 TaxID=3435410 RepID=UPI003D7CE21D